MTETCPPALSRRAGQAVAFARRVPRRAPSPCGACRIKRLRMSAQRGQDGPALLCAVRSRRARHLCGRGLRLLDERERVQGLPLRKLRRGLADIPDDGREGVHESRDCLVVSDGLLERSKLGEVGGRDVVQMRHEPREGFGVTTEQRRRARRLDLRDQRPRLRCSGGANGVRRRDEMRACRPARGCASATTTGGERERGPLRRLVPGISRGAASPQHPRAPAWRAQQGAGHRMMAAVRMGAFRLPRSDAIGPAMPEIRSVSPRLSGCDRHARLVRLARLVRHARLTSPAPSGPASAGSATATPAPRARRARRRPGRRGRAPRV